MVYGCPRGAIDRMLDENSQKYESIYFNPQKNCQSLINKLYPTSDVLEKQLVSDPVLNIGAKPGAYSQCLENYFKSPLNRLRALPAVYRNFFNGDLTSFANSALIDYYYTMNALRSAAVGYIVQVAAIDHELGDALMAPSKGGGTQYGSTYFPYLNEYTSRFKPCSPKKNGLSDLTVFAQHTVVDVIMSLLRIDRITALEAKQDSRFRKFYYEKDKANDVIKSARVFFPWIVHPSMLPLLDWKIPLKTKDPLYDFHIVYDENDFKKSNKKAKAVIKDWVFKNTDKFKAAVRATMNDSRQRLVGQLDDISEASRCLHAQGLVESVAGSCTRHIQKVLSNVHSWEPWRFDESLLRNSVIVGLSAQGKCMTDVRNINANWGQVKLDAAVTALMFASVGLTASAAISVGSSLVGATLAAEELAAITQVVRTVASRALAAVSAATVMTNISSCSQKLSATPSITESTRRWAPFLSQPSSIQCFTGASKSKDRASTASERLGFDVSIDSRDLLFGNYGLTFTSCLLFSTARSFLDEK